VEAKLALNEQACATAIQSLGGLCPTCGGELGDAAHFLAHEIGDAA
jgi:hypothetical protein